MLPKWLAATALLVFSAYTLYCARTESFWGSCRAVFARRWGRQVVADLYIGLGLFMCLVHWHEQSALVTIAWLVPTLVFGNLTTLVYFVLHFDGLLAHFTAGFPR